MGETMRWVVFVGLIVSCGPARAGVEQLYGTWRGVWSPTYKFTGNHVQFGQPPYAPAQIEFVLHAFTTADDYGQFHIQSPPGSYVYDGQVVGLNLTGDTVGLTVFYPNENSPNGYGDVVGTLSGSTFAGTFNERYPVAPGFIHWEGPFTVSAVPEPALVTALSLGLTGLVLRRRRWAATAGTGTR
jgi:hypothetical protein